MTTGPLFTKILDPVDFSPCSNAAFYVALSLARIFQAEVLFLHVMDTKSLQSLNVLGLAPSSEEKTQIRKLRSGSPARIG